MEAKELKAAASLPELLEALGHRPEKQHGQELIYHLSGPKPCFAVNQEHNIWYDHHTGKGGNIIDFAMTYWKVTFREALKKLNEHFSLNQLPEYGRLQCRRRHAQKLPHYRLQHSTPLGSNAEITVYLQARCIWEVSQTVLSEVYYYVQDEKGHIKPFSAAGLQNELGHWQVSSQNFNGCLGHAAISFIHRSETQVSIFQDIISYLSWQSDYPNSTNSILILNSDDLLLAAIRKIKDFQEISVLFNRDDTGRLKSAELIQALPQATDRSAIYEGHTHYNDWLVKRTKRIQTFKR
jgi:hypothetical protein